MFEKCIENIKSIIKQINESIKSINTAIDKYNMAMSSISGIAGLETVTDNKQDKAYTPEQNKVLESIEKNFNANRVVNTKFNDRLVEEVKKDLKSKGILE